MFERLLERVLQRSLGKYIEDLDRRQLSVSVWSGKIELENLNLKRGLIEKLRLPVNLLMGKIGKLKINVPWNNLSSKPVEVVIESVNIVVTPKGRNEWTDIKETMNTDNDIRKRFLDKFTSQLFNDLIKAKEVVESEQGMFARMATRTVDNLQVQIQNLHVRFESNNPHFSKDLFSMGCTLEQLNIHTTNDQWQVEFMDRTRPEQSTKPLFKILVIQNFGFYYKPNDVYFICDLESEEQRLAQLNQLFPAGTSKIAQYTTSYLLEPVKLITKLKLEPKQNFRASIVLDIENVDICMQKNQLVNILRLLELDQQYTKKQDRYQCAQMQKFQTDLTALQYTFKGEDTPTLFKRLYLNRRGAENIFKAVKDASQAEPKEDFNQLEGESGVQQSEEDLFFWAIMMGTKIDTLKEWLSAISKEKANEYLENVSHQQQVADSQKGLRSYIGSFFYKDRQSINETPGRNLDSQGNVGSQPTEDDEFLDALDSPEQMTVEERSPSGDALDSEDEFYDAQESEDLIMKQLSEQFQIDEIDVSESKQTDSATEEESKTTMVDTASETAAAAESSEQQLDQDQLDSEKDESTVAVESQSRINADFRLGKFSLTLLYDHVERNGIQIFMKEFGINFKKYDSAHEKCPFAYELRACNELFGIYSIDAAKQKVAILEQISSSGAVAEVAYAEESKEQRESGTDDAEAKQVLKLVLIKHNIFSDQGTLPDAAKVAKPPATESSTEEQASEHRNYGIDMDISVVVQPIKLIFRPIEIEKLVNFFYIEDLKPETKFQAQALQASLTQRLNSHVKESLEMHELKKRKNKVKIEITCPVLEVPFSNNPQWRHEQEIDRYGEILVEEKWVIAMGDLLITNFQPGTAPNTVREQGDVTQATTHKNFLLKLTNSYFKYQRGAWVGDIVSEPTQVIGNFNLDVLISVRKKGFESQGLLVPKLRIGGKMSDLAVSLTPYTYCHFSQIHKLFFGEASVQADSAVQRNQHSLFKLRNKASIQGTISKQEHPLDTVKTVYALLHTDTLFFYSDTASTSSTATPKEQQSKTGESPEVDDKVNQALDALFLERDYTIQDGSTDREPLREFSLKNCSIIKSSDCTLSLANGKSETCDLTFKTVKQMAAWKEAIESSVKLMELSIEETKQQSQTTAQDGEETSPFESADKDAPESPLNDKLIDTATESGQADPVAEDQKSHLVLKSIISFEIPSINLTFAAEKKELNPEQGVFDDYDAGLFKSREDDITSWKLILETKNWKIEQIRKTLDSDMRISLEKLQVVEAHDSQAKTGQERFPWLIRSDQGFSIDINRCTRGTEEYKNIDMVVRFSCGTMRANWKPKAINRLLRFLRFKNYKRLAFKQCLNQSLFRFKQMKLIEKEKEPRLGGATSSQLNGEKKKLQNCETDPQILMKILVKIESLQLMCMHPQNDSYPIFSANGDRFSFDYNMFFDHDTHHLSIRTLEILDHTQYPHTLDPSKIYSRDAHVEASKILMRKSTASKTQNMIDMAILMFHFPMERTCPKSWLDEHKHQDKYVKIDLRCCRLNFIQEYFYRLYEYFYYQMMGALSDSNPFLEGRKKADSVFKELISLARKTANPLNTDELGSENTFEKLDPLTCHPNWTILNAPLFSELQQSPFCTGMDLKIDHPLLILKDRFYKQHGEIQAHFSQIAIHNETSKKKGRYRKQPDKTIDMTTMVIKCKGLSMQYSQSIFMKQKAFTVMPPTNFVIEKESVTWSPVLDKKQFLTQGIDFTDLDFAQHFRIKCDPIRLTMVQEVFTYFMQVSDLNLNFVDMNQKKFQLGIWDDPDSQKFLRLEEETRKKYRDHQIVYKQKIDVQIPSLAMVLLSSDDPNLDVDRALIAELVFWNFRFSMLKFHDFRKILDLTSHSLQILRNLDDSGDKTPTVIKETDPELHQVKEDNRNQDFLGKDQPKSVLMGHISSSNVIFANDDYYLFNVDKIIRGDEGELETTPKKVIPEQDTEQSNPTTQSGSSSKGRINENLQRERRFKRRKNMLLKNHFEMNIEMYPSGEKIYKINLDQPKVVARADIFLMISDFFKSGFPKYQADEWDKPNGWSDDPNCQRRQEILVEMRQALVCFPNEETAEKTVVCAGDMILTKTRENINQVKLRLLDRMDKAQTHQQHQQFLSQSVMLQDSNEQRSSLINTTILEPAAVNGNEGFNIDYDYSTRTSIMLVALTEFCPYFCSVEDLNGKQLKDLKKREIMSPFNVHFNVIHMIELVRQGQNLHEAVRELVFKKFKKTDISLDWTLLKLSFQDLQIFKQIFEYNTGLIRKRSEKMAQVNEESSDFESQDSETSSDCDDELPFHRDRRPRILAATPIGPQPKQASIQVHEPSMNDSQSDCDYDNLEGSRETNKRDSQRSSAKKRSKRGSILSQSQKLPIGAQTNSAETLPNDKNQLNPEKKPSQNKGGSVSSNSRQVKYRRSKMQEFSSLDSAKELIQTFAKGKRQTSPSTIINSSSGGTNTSENLQDDFEKQRSQMNAFYFVRRDSLKAEEARLNKRIKAEKNRKEKLQKNSGGDSGGANLSEEDEANIGVDDITVEDTIVRTLSMNSEKKTKALVELTSQNQANRITEEDSETDSIGTDSDDYALAGGENNYNNLRAISIADLQRFSDTKVLQIVEEELGHDNMQVVSFGLQFIVINDYMGNYLPVFGVSVSQLAYNFGMTASKMEGSTNLRSSASYFNAIEGSWEPIVELFDVEMKYTKLRDNCKEFEFKVQEDLNLNVTKCLLQTLRDTYTSIMTQRTEANEKHDIFKKRPYTQRKKISHTVSGSIDFDLLERVDEEESKDGDEGEKKSSLALALECNNDAIVSPYAIRNLTEAEIVIQKPLTEEEYWRKEQHQRRKRDKMQKPAEPLQAITEEVLEQANEFDSDNESEFSLATSYKGSESQQKGFSAQSAMSSVLDSSSNKYRDRREREKMLQLSQSYYTKSSNKVRVQQHFKSVLKVGPCETKDHAVNYDAQLQKQIASFKDMNSSERLEELIQVNFGRKSKTAIKEVNLNKSLKPQRHYFLAQKFKEFIVYSVEFENMKRVLTLRTQYIMVNNTLHDYDIKIISLFNKDQHEMKMLKAGQSLPIPECYNQSVMQIKLTRNKADSDWSEEWQIYALKKIVEIDKPGYLKHGSSYTFFRKQQAKTQETFDICLMPPLILQNCLPVEVSVSFEDSNKQRQKIELVKEETRNIFDFDLQNKIQLILQIQGYSRTSLVLDTKKELIDEEEKIALLMKDEAGRKLHVNVQICQKTAGFKVCLYNTNCLINNSGQNLLFFYKEPSHDEMIFEADRDIMVSQPIESSARILAGGNSGAYEQRKDEDVVHMLSSTKEVFAKIDGSKAVSEPIITFTHGTRSQFCLVQRNKLLEFGYFTYMYRCMAEGSLYTKITTIQPRYMVVNYTQSTLVFAQACMKANPLIVKSGQQQPFHWNDKNGPKLMSVQIIPSEAQFAQAVYDWSVGFSLEQTGSLTIHNREKKEEHFIAQDARLNSHAQTARRGRSTNSGGFFANIFNGSAFEDKKEELHRLQPICKAHKRLLRINRKLHEQQTLIIVEEEEEELPEMRIENKCSNVSIVFQQLGNKAEEEIDVCDPKEAQAFAWSDPQGSKTLKIQFFKGRYQFSSENQNTFNKSGGTSTSRGKAQGPKQPLNLAIYNDQIRDEIILDELMVTFDRLNQKKTEIMFCSQDRNLQPVYFSIVTNGYTRILRFDNVPPARPGAPTNPNQPEEEKKGSGTEENQSLNKLHTFIKMVNISICSPGKELMSLHLKQIKASIIKTARETSLDFSLTSIQIDNQSEVDPVYPVMLKPTDLRAEIARQAQEEAKQIDMIREEDVFQLALTMRSDFPNVIYFSEVAFLVQRIDLKLELAHVMLLYEFGKDVNKIFNRKLVNQHKIFKNQLELPLDGFTPDQDDDFFEERKMPPRPESQPGGGIIVQKVYEEDDDQVGDHQAQIDLMLQMDQLALRGSESTSMVRDPSSALNPQMTRQITYLEKYLEKVRSKNTIVNNIRETRLKRQSEYRSTTGAVSSSKVARQSLQSQKQIVVRQKTNSRPLNETITSYYESDEDRSDDEELVVEQVKQENAIKRVYIERFFSSPFVIRISIMKQGQIENDKTTEEIAFVKKIANIGLSIMSLEQMPLTINAFEIQHVYGDLTDIAEQFKAYYKQQLKSNTLSLFGGSNLLGNPNNLIDTLGSGFKDFYYEPANGFKKGVKEGSIGFMVGTGSLVRNTVGGTIGSVGKISSSIGSALLYLTGDQQFREERSRQMIRRTPQTVMQGLESGFGTAMDSTISGFKGVVQKPVEGARQDGVQGFAVGALKGVAGLLVKPVTGAMDLVSRTSQGIESSTKKEAIAVDERMRPPRVFYGKEKVIRNYDIVHANLILIIPKLKYCLPELPEEPLHIDMRYFLDAWVLVENTRMYDWSVLLTTGDQLIRINRYSSKRAKQQDMEQTPRLKNVFVGDSLIQISSVNSYSQMLSIELHESKLFDIVFEDSRELLEVNDKHLAETIYRTVKSVYNEVERIRKEPKNQSLLSYNRSVSTTQPLSRSTKSKLPSYNNQRSGNTSGLQY